MLSGLALMELQAVALFRHDAAGRIVTTNEPDGAEPRVSFLTACVPAISGVFAPICCLPSSMV
jgi:hypothetical protein